MTLDINHIPAGLSSPRLWLLWIWCAGAIWFFVWGTDPFVRYDGTDVFEFLLNWVWFAGPMVALVSVLAALRPSAFQVLRTLSLAHLGVAVGLSVVALSLRWNQTATEMTFKLVVTIVTGALANIPILLLAYRRGALGASNRWHLGIFALSLSLPVLALMVWSQVNIVLVETRAMVAAGSAPFCLQVADGSGYREAVRHDDFSGLTMQAPYQAGSGSEDYQLAFHAMLIVDEGGSKSHYNWSYVSQTFVPVRSTGLFFGVVCTPRVGFVHTLS